MRGQARPCQMLRGDQGQQERGQLIHTLALLRASAGKSVLGVRILPSPALTRQGLALDSKSFWSGESPSECPIWPQTFLLLKGPGMHSQQSAPSFLLCLLCPLAACWFQYKVKPIWTLWNDNSKCKILTAKTEMGTQMSQPLESD